MKKILLAILIVGMVCVMMACKKNTADTAENIGNTTVEASESAEPSEATTFVPMETVDNLQLELKEGQVGEVTPD